MSAKLLEFIIEIHVVSSQGTINSIQTQRMPGIEIIPYYRTGSKGRGIEMLFHIDITHIIRRTCENSQIGLFLGGGYCRDREEQNQKERKLREARTCL